MFVVLVGVVHAHLRSELGGLGLVPAAEGPLPAGLNVSAVNGSGAPTLEKHTRPTENLKENRSSTRSSQPEIQPPRTPVDGTVQCDEEDNYIGPWFENDPDALNYAMNQTSPLAEDGKGHNCTIWGRRTTCPENLTCDETDIQTDRQARTTVGPNGRDAYVLSDGGLRFDDTKEVLGKVRDPEKKKLFNVVRVPIVTSTTWFGLTNDTFDPKRTKSMGQRVFSNYLGFLNTLRMLHTCSGPGKWAYVFEDDIMWNHCVTGQEAQVVGLLNRAEAAATAKGDALLLGGVCLGGAGCHKNSEDLQQCSGACAHAWAVNTSRALEVYNMAVDHLKRHTKEMGASYFDLFIHKYGMSRNGLITLLPPRRSNGSCTECNDPGFRGHCGLWKQDRVRHPTTIGKMNGKGEALC